MAEHFKKGDLLGIMTPPEVLATQRLYKERRGPVHFLRYLHEGDSEFDSTVALARGGAWGPCPKNEQFNLALVSVQDAYETDLYPWVVNADNLVRSI